MPGKPRFRRVGQEAGDLPAQLQPRDLQRLAHAAIREDGLVIDEIEVTGAQEAKVGLENDDFSTWFQQLPNPLQQRDNPRRTVEMLQEVAQEHAVEICI